MLLPPAPFLILSNENIAFCHTKTHRDKPATCYEPTATTMASEPIRPESITHSCILQVCRNVGLNGTLQLRSEILDHFLCFPQLSFPLHLQIALSTVKALLENQPKF